MKHKLLSIPRTNLLYLPILKLNDVENASGTPLNDNTNQANGQYIVTVDKNTNDQTKNSGGTSIKGRIRGFAKTAGGEGASNVNIVIDQGLQTDAIPHTFALDPDLRETRYIIEIDNRLGAITNESGQVLTPNFIDDDNVASYTVTQNSSMVTTLPLSDDSLEDSVITGPRGTRLKFSIAASVELNSSSFLFTKLGSSTGQFENAAGTTFSGGNFLNIDSVVKVTGGSTGRSVDIPVRFIKLLGAG